MRFENVCIESLAVVLPDEVWTSAAIEERLRPLYERLKLPFGRLELMSGIRERRAWPPGTRPSAASAAAGRAVLARSGVAAEQIEHFIHAAVSRDMLEPATAAFAHHQIGLPPTAQIFDLSNACLGFLNALAVAGAMIESGQISCAMVAAVFMAPLNWKMTWAVVATPEAPLAGTTETIVAACCAWSGIKALIAPANATQAAAREARPRK